MAKPLIFQRFSDLTPRVSSGHVGLVSAQAPPRGNRDYGQPPLAASPPEPVVDTGLYDVRVCRDGDIKWGKDSKESGASSGIEMDHLV